MENSKENEMIRLFKFNKEQGKFEELPEDEIPEDGIKEILESSPDSSFAIFQMDKYLVWLYHGVETDTRMKFMSAREITNLRDEILLGGKVLTVDQGSEPLPFQFLVKMKDPKDFGLSQNEAVLEYKPAYAGTDEDDQKLEKISLDNLALLLEQVQTPAGYEREAVIHDNKLYAVKLVRRKYMGTEIEDIELVPFPKDVNIENGVYFNENLKPRLLFENNQLRLVEILRKI
ncbi:MAG: hypothetical protein ACTSWN_10325 [Promethearchaeota archaeon]